ncbi:hypothetical protein O181_000405 [Austropuccinia psidii MF-1]|uniref:Uncharacterized protein n=1 Tax=Austropuccinia psidii MF-1 TaxID=1389203 RepID=A0A9Q3GAU7_9BASI|nr:hypothetical protein [Austropuccinia psidii MF-1]
MPTAVPNECCQTQEQLTRSKRKFTSESHSQTYLSWRDGRASSKRTKNSKPEIIEIDAPVKNSLYELPRSAGRSEPSQSPARPRLFSFCASEQDVAWVAAKSLSIPNSYVKPTWIQATVASAFELQIVKMKSYAHTISIPRELDLLELIMGRVWDLNAVILEYFFVFKKKIRMQLQEEDNFKKFFHTQIWKLGKLSNPLDHSYVNWELFWAVFHSPETHSTMAKSWKVNIAKPNAANPQPEWKIVRPLDILINRVAINFVGAYYKAKNLEKWQRLFPQDRNFVEDLLKAVQFRLCTGEFLEADISLYRNLWPWSDPVDAKQVVFQCPTDVPSSLDDRVKVVKIKKTRT